MTHQDKTVKPAGMTRRGFLIRAGAGAALTMGYGFYGKGAMAQGMISPNMNFDIHSDGRVTVHIPKAEMGQHVGTALSQALAEELECGWDNIQIDYVGFDPRFGLHITGGSWSVNWTFDALSRAGAAGRIALIEAAAAELGGAPADYTVTNGVISGNGKQITYGEIAAKGITPRQFTEEDLKELTLKPADQRQIVGKSKPALDIPAKTNGTATYGMDVVLDGMVYATPAVPPVRYGASVKSVDDSAAQAIKGYIRHVVINDPIGTQTGWVMAVADSYWTAKKAAEALKIEYDLGPNAGVSLADIHAESARLLDAGENGRIFVKDGDADAAMAAADSTMRAEYRTDVNIHAPMEPMNATVEIKDGNYHIHCGNQFQTLATGLVAALGVPAENIIMHQQLLGGGFGRRLDADYVVQACLTARELDRPVKLIYSREADTLMDFTRPAATIRMQVGIKDGKIDAWTSASASAWASARQAPAFLSPDLSGNPDNKMDAFAINGADHWYTIPNQGALLYQNMVAQNALPPGHLRSVGPGWQFFAVESFMDEIAHELGRDPLELRLSLLDATGKNAGSGITTGGAKRLAAVLQNVADRAGYGTARPDGTGLGLACVSSQERGSASWTACAAEVTVDPADGHVTVKKLTLATEVGTAVNPDGVKAQLTGSALWGVSLAMHEVTDLQNGAIQASNYDGYTPLRMFDLPEIDAEVLSVGGYPTGCGEPGTTVVAPAIANAIFAATGARVRTLPITPAKVKAAM